MLGHILASLLVISVAFALPNPTSQYDEFDTVLQELLELDSDLQFFDDLSFLNEIVGTGDVFEPSSRSRAVETSPPIAQPTSSDIPLQLDKISELFVDTDGADLLDQVSNFGKTINSGGNSDVYATDFDRHTEASTEIDNVPVHQTISIPQIHYDTTDAAQVDPEETPEFGADTRAALTTATEKNVETVYETTSQTQNQVTPDFYIPPDCILDQGVIVKPTSQRFDTLYKAIMTHHRASKILSCPIPGCSDKITRQNIKLHMRCHLNEYIYQCPYPSCGFEYLIKTQAIRHVKGHETSRNYNSFVNDILAKCLDKCGNRDETDGMDVNEKIKYLETRVRAVHCGSKFIMCPVDTCGCIVEDKYLKRHFELHFKVCHRKVCKFCGMLMYPNTIRGHEQMHETRNQIDHQKQNEIDQLYAYLESIYLK